MRLRCCRHPLRRSRPASDPDPGVPRSGARARDPGAHAHPAVRRRDELRPHRADHRDVHRVRRAARWRGAHDPAAVGARDPRPGAVVRPRARRGRARGVHRHPRADRENARARRGAGARADPHPGVHHRGRSRGADAGAGGRGLPAPASRRRARSTPRTHHGGRRGRRCSHGDLPAAGSDRLDARRDPRARGRRPRHRGRARRLDAEHLDEPAARHGKPGSDLRAGRQSVHRPGPRPAPARSPAGVPLRLARRRRVRTSRCSRSSSSRGPRGV